MSQLQLTADILLNEGQLDARLQAVADEARARLSRAGEIGLSVENVGAVQEQLSGVEKTLGTIKTLGAGALLGGALVGIHDVYTTAQQLDNAQTILAHIEGSASKAQDQVRALNQLAINTPLSLKDVLTANQYLALAQKQLQDLGDTQQISATKVITSLGDVSQSLGKGAQGVNDSAKALMEAVEQGGIYANLQRMLRADIPNYKGIIAQQLFGSDKDASQVTTDVLHTSAAVDALIKALNSDQVGAGIAGTMAAANQSLQGTVQRVAENIESNLGLALDQAAPTIEKFLNNVGAGFTDLSKVITPMAHIIGSIPGPLIQVGQTLLLLKVGSGILASVKSSSQGLFDVWRMGGVDAVKSGISDITTGTVLAGTSMRSQVAQARAVIASDSAAVRAFYDGLIVAQQEQADAARRTAQTLNDELRDMTALSKAIQTLTEDSLEVEELAAAMELLGVDTEKATLYVERLADEGYFQRIRLEASLATTAAHDMVEATSAEISALEDKASAAAAAYARVAAAASRGSMSASLATSAAMKAKYVGPVTESGPAVTQSVVANSGVAAAAAGASASKAQAAANDEVATSATRAASATSGQAAADEEIVSSSNAATEALRTQAAASEEVGAASETTAARMGSSSRASALMLGGFVGLSLVSSELNSHLRSTSDAATGLKGALSGATMGAGIGMFIGPEGAAAGAAIGGLFGGLYSWMEKDRQKALETKQTLDGLYSTIAKSAPGSGTQTGAIDSAVKAGVSTDDLKKLGLSYQEIETYISDANKAGSNFMKTMSKADMKVWAAQMGALGDSVSGDSSAYGRLSKVLGGVITNTDKAKAASKALAEQQKTDGTTAANRLTNKLQAQTDAMSLMSNAASDTKDILGGLHDKTMNTAQAMATAQNDALGLVNQYEKLDASEKNTPSAQAAIARSIYEVGAYAGMTKGQIAAMGSTLLKMPKSAFIAFASNAPTIGQEIDTLAAKIAALAHQQITVNGVPKANAIAEDMTAQYTQLVEQAKQQFAALTTTPSVSDGSLSFAAPADIMPSSSGSSGGSGGSSGKGSKAAKSAKQTLASAEKEIHTEIATVTKSITTDWNKSMTDAFTGDVSSVKSDYADMNQYISGEISSITEKKKDASKKAVKAYNEEISSLNAQKSALDATEKSVLTYTSQINAQNAAIAAAKTQLDALTSAESDQKQATLDQVSSLASLDGLTSADQMLKVLQAATTQTAAFQKNLVTLKADVGKGLLSQQAYDQLAAMGPGSESLIASVANAPATMLSQINSQANALSSAGNKLGDYVSQSMYQSGIDAASKYVSGLTAGLKTIEGKLNKAGVTDIDKILKVLNKAAKGPNSYASDEPTTSTTTTVTLSTAQLQSFAAAASLGFQKALTQAQQTGVVLL